MDGRDEVRGARGRNAGNTHPTCPATDPGRGCHATPGGSCLQHLLLSCLPAWLKVSTVFARLDERGAGIVIFAEAPWWSRPTARQGECATARSRLRHRLRTAPKRVPSWRVLPG
jgi:hypothetical protein